MSEQEHFLVLVACVRDLETRSARGPVTCHFTEGRENQFLNFCGLENWMMGKSQNICKNSVGLIFGPKRDEVTGEWRKLHNEELYDLYCSPNIVWVIKSRRMGGVGHVAWMGEGKFDVLELEMRK